MDSKRKWVAVPALRSDSVSLNFKFKIILSIILIAALLGPLSMYISISRKPQIIQSGSVNYQSLSIATIAAEEYLSGKDISVPMADGLKEELSSHVTIESLPYDSISLFSTQDKNIGGVFYSMYYYLVSSNGSLYILTISTIYNGSTYLLANIPTIGTYNVTLTKENQIDYSSDPLLVQSGLPAPVTKVISLWASAYANGDGEAMKTVTNNTSEFSVLNGFKLSGEPVVSTVLQSGSNYLVRVVINLSYEGSKFKAPSAYDLLIDSVGTQQPHVVSWAPAGTAPTTPYINLKK